MNTKRPALRTMIPCFAFHDSITGTGFLMYQDSAGRAVARGESALRAWREMGRPNVTSFAHAQQLGLC